ncbi:MAG: hypothetical protein MJA29_07140 [Candidatus Omnitrophica bacterium]|nr:hypothetical protein [Candidatus Omnitrophota bacterium]
MEIAKLILDYLKVLLTWPVVFLIVALIFIFKFKEDLKALILRIAKIKLPGGTELTTPQSKRLKEEELKTLPKTDTESLAQMLPDGLTSDQRDAVEKLLSSHKATSYLWEYRYLNYYLVFNTQIVLDWFIGLNQPIAYSFYDSTWLPTISSANEREAIITALQAHHLIQQDTSGLITVTPKGKEYHEWRGPMRPPENKATE